MIISHEELTKLNDNQFEKLVKTLLISVIGNGVTPFSQGKDGAREAIYKGKANYPSKINTWDGNWIFQVKYSNITFGLDKARKQIKYSIDNELKKLEDYGYFESNKCDNYVYITNVPFSGEASKGLHDYIENKSKNYKIKNFDYWDGEKIIGFLNTFAIVRETFFPSPGIEILEESFFSEVNNTFVKPGLYDSLREEIIKNKVLNIVGQPHVGKSFLALFLAQDIFLLKNLNEILLIPIIDDLTSIPKITNCIIIFDDLYGDLNYDSIGKQTKIVNTLSKNNYVIITSRDYIFEEASINKELITGNRFVINQEGAYNDSQLMRILLNHIKINFPLTSENIIAHKFIIHNKLQIIRKLRFPHNIQLFTTIIDHNVVTKKLLDEKIGKAKVIENLIITWMGQQQIMNSNILLVLAIGKIQDKELLYNICKTNWNYSINNIEECLIENSRLLYQDLSIIRFKHPSFKNAIVSFFLENHNKTISDLILFLVFSPNSLKKLINKALAYKIIEGLETESLVNILKKQQISRNYLEIIWLNLIRRDKNRALELLLHKLENKRNNLDFISFVSSKSFMADSEILIIINFLMKKREESPIIDTLIVQFAHRVRLKIRDITDCLDYKIPKDFSLKMKLLGSIGSKHPDMVFAELVSYAYESLPSSRRQVYAAINMLDRSACDKIVETYLEILTRETDAANIKKIKGALRKMRKV